MNMNTIEMEKVFVPPIERRKIRVDEYQKITQLGILPEESGWEIINGEIIRRMSIGSSHAGAVKKINRILAARCGKNFIISIQDPIRIDDYNEPEPDVAVLSFREDIYTKSNPIPSEVLIVIEVSDSTIKYDREIKKQLYAGAQIPEFWLVDLNGKTVEVHTQPRHGNYRNISIYEKNEVLKSNVIETLTVDLNDILD